MNLQAVMLDRLPLDRGDLDFAPIRAAVDQLVCHDATAPGEIADRLAGFDVVLVNKVQLDRAALAAADRLKLVLVMATGTNNVDTDACRDLGISVCNCRGYATPAVIQHVTALLTALASRWHDYDAAIRRGDWQPGTFCLLDYPIAELAGRRLGIVGHGELGGGVARVAEALGMTVLVAERPGARDIRPGRLSFDAVLAQADALTLHCPLTQTTRHLIDADALAAMPDHALLINTARGGLVDEAALADALRAGEIGGAGIDVFSREPPPADHPLLADNIPNLIITPHSAWGSLEARRRLVAQLAENLLAFRDGAPIRLV
ncbi:MAG: 2-hydroxyacid dehydrogenase [Phycisphaerales bacterium]